MKVLLVAGVDLSLPGGLETHVRELALGLAERGVEVDVLGRPVPLPPLRMVDRIEPGRYGLIHDHTGRGLRGSVAGTPVVRTLHFCVAAKMATYLRIGRLRTLVNLDNWRAIKVERERARSGAAHIAVSERVRREFARFHGIDPAGVRVIPNGASFAAPREPRERLRARHGIASTSPVALTVGRDDFVKGFDLFARAWSRSGAAERGAVWVTVGGRVRGRSGSRIVTGPVPQQEVVDWIHAADFGALPSWYEGCSLALLDMLAGGLYCLAHDVGNAAQVIRPGENGEILPPGTEGWSAALGRLSSDPPARRAHGLDPSYGWGAIATRIEEVYRATLAGS
jgi:glycosyltransferase involved in cell wall biosynthesis